MKKGLVGVLSTIVGSAVAVGGTRYVMAKKVKERSDMSDKHLALFLLMNQWVKVKQEGKSLVSYFDNNGYKKIAIYGMSYAGETLARELEDSDIEIKYGIDKKSDNIYAEFDIVSPEDYLAEVDAIVVTSITFFDEIEEKLSEKIGCPILSLEDILYEV